MYYFLKENRFHCYPVPKRCHVKYEDEQLRDTILHGFEECPFCMRRWPANGEL